MPHQSHSIDHAVPAEVMATCAVLHTRKAARAVTQLFDAVLQPSGLRATQFTLLIAVSLAGDLPLSALADTLAMDRTTLARELKLLAHEGLVTIAVAQDRRARVVTLTRPGQEALARALPLWAQAQARIESQVGADHWRSARAHLDKLVAAATA